MLDISFLGAATAGILSFFTPCVLPMVPFYLCYMAGISMNELRGEDTISPTMQRRLVISSVFFALGVTSIFMLMGLGATSIGQVFGQWRQPLSYLSAAVLFAFGLHFLGVVRIPLLYREARFQGGDAPKTLAGAYVMGLAFGFGWTPCVGPALASILMIASGFGDIWKGAALLGVYGLGMTAPFIIAALFAKPFLNWMQKHMKYAAHVEKAMGVMLILFAVLIATNSINLIAQWMIETFPAFTQFG